VKLIEPTDEAEVLLIVLLSAQAANYMPCLRSDHSLSDKLRFATSRGQVDYLRQLLTSGIAAFESDAVSCTLTVILYIYLFYFSVSATLPILLIFRLSLLTF